MQNDILRAIDICHCVILLLLDLSTTFGSINHDIFLRRLNSKFLIYGTALDWFRSYLTDRKQSTLIKGKKRKIAVSCSQMRSAAMLCSLAYPVFTLHCTTGKHCTTPHDAISLLRCQYSVIYFFFNQQRPAINQYYC